MIFHPLLLTIGLALPRKDTLQYDASIYGKITVTDGRRRKLVFVK
jgi:hypothetical protein